MNESKVSDEQISGALINYYTPPEAKSEVVDEQQLVELLQKLPGLSEQGQAGTLLTQIHRHHQSITLSLSRKDHATLSFIDDAIGKLFAQTDLDFKVESQIRHLSAYLAIEAIENGPLVEGKESPILNLIDLLMKECVGWSEDLGVLGDQFMQKIEDLMLPLVNGRLSLEECIKQLRIDFEKESSNFKKMESRLANDELGIVTGKNARSHSARVINNEMSGQKLPLFIIFMLQGVWHEFLQNIFVRYGPKSKEWTKATKLTEGLVWSLQPRKDKQKHNSLMDNLPDQILRHCSKMDFDTAAVEQSLADVSAEYEQLRNNTPSDPCEFDLLDLDEDLLAGADKLGAVIKKEIASLTTGSWFLYDDAKEADEKVARLNLILNLPQENLLLFTNHNHRKAMQLTYQQMATYRGNGTIKRLNAGFTTEQIIKAYLKEVLQKVSDQNKKGKQLDKKDKRRVSEEYQQERKSAQEESLRQQEQMAQLKKKRSIILRKKAQQKLDLAVNAVESLRPDAWVKLPIMEGILTPCRLVAILPDGKYIFANRAGVKIAEYTMNQLSNLIVTENSEILDTGAEFEAVLANVVAGLRDSKTKSYDELTGESG
ncbi:MAG: DUF1631 family protein [Gammaproteobacteria bacterium]|nr:DUF1631 family protein [Gammaproteobacteria bacterium]